MPHREFCDLLRPVLLTAGTKISIIVIVKLKYFAIFAPYQHITIMDTAKQLRIIETKSKYRVIEGRLYRKYRGEWGEKACSVIGGYRQHQLCNGRGWGKEVAYEHQIVWLYANGVYDGVIDHIDHDRGNNRIENLRVVTASENKLHPPHSSRVGMTYNVVYDFQIVALIEAYLSGKSKTESAKMAKMSRLTGLYHLNRFIAGVNTGYVRQDRWDELRLQLSEMKR
jgi:hypothetical protein